ncbi:MAG TPA: hypothetical protein VNC16_02230 [Solirubrobacterales bacterium]|jgi:hypothetical protein|nr:hypothetical protein [Solirubrobacterales bacterium]
MQGKAPLSNPPASQSSSDGLARIDDKLYDLWGSAGPEKPKQVERQAGLTLVPIDGIRELDRSQRQLSTMIKLAIAVFNERLKAERASVSARHLAPNDSDGDVDHWYELIQEVEAIATLDAEAGGASAPQRQVGEALDRFHEAQRRASKTAGEIASDLNASGVELPKKARKFEMSGAIGRICRALEQCAATCDDESRESLKRIEYRLHSFLEQIPGKDEPNAKPSEYKQPGMAQERGTESSVALEDRKLTEPGDDDHLKQLKER